MTTTNPDLDHSALPQAVSKKDKKPYNGYLRNTNRKQQKPIKTENTTTVENNFLKPTPQDAYKKQVKKTNNHNSSNNVNNINRNKQHKERKPYYNHINHIQHHNNDLPVFEEEEIVNSVNHFSRERQLLSYIRQKSGFNPQYFLKELEDILVEKKFADLSSDNHSLISQLVLHSKEDVFPCILNKYGNQVSKEEFENVIFPYSLNKNATFLQESLPFYIKQYKSTNEFLENLIIRASKTSYRSENNAILLAFFNKKCLKKHQELFWKSCIENKNIVLFEAALKYKKLHTFLIKNLNEYEDSITQLGKIHTVKRSIEQIDYIDTSDEKEEEEPVINEIQVKTFLGNHEEQFQSLQKKEINKPEVIIRKKRKII